MRKIIITLVLVTISGGGYLLYESWFKSEQLTLWSLVPESAVLVYENTDLIDTWNRLQTIPTWESISNIQSIDQLDGHLTLLDSLMGGDDILQRITSKNPVLISLHITSQNQFDFLFQLEVNNIESHAAVWQALDQLKDKGFRSDKRNYQGHTLTEITRDEDVLTYIFYQNYFIGSFTPFLVEDVIRTIDDPQTISFEAQHIGLFSLVKLQNDAGNLYINSKRFGDFINVFADDLKFNSSELNQLVTSTFLDLSFDDKSISLNGFSIVDAKSSSLLTTFYNNPATTFELSNLIPSRTAIFYHYSMTDSKKWNESLQSFWEKNQPQTISSRALILEQYDVDVNQYFDWIQNEIGVATMESNDLDNPNKLAFVKTNDSNEAFKQLSQLADRSLKPSDSAHTEIYDDIRITRISINDFPKSLFGQSFNQFNTTFFTIQDEYIVMANNVEAIKSWYEDYSNDNTWGKSLKSIQFLDETLKEANFSLYVNSNRAWNAIRDNLSSDWLRFSEENSGVIRRFEMSAFQFSYIDNKFYTSVVFNQLQGNINSDANYVERQSIEFAAPIITKPYIVRNHTNGEFETLLQDSLSNLYLIGADGEVLWTDSIDQRIKTDVFQVDYFKNGKLQYLFATDYDLHLIDRNGDYVAPYPIRIKEDKKIDYLSLVDYDKSKRYRFMVADESGDIYLYDKNGKNLDGWKPKKLSGALAAPAFHRRIRSRDRMVAVEKKGILNVISRTGQMSKGFPIDLKANSNSPVFVSAGSSFENSTLTTITDEGEIVSVNFLGQILKREQLYKPTTDTRFSTLPDALGQSYVFIRNSANRLAVIDPAGEVLFEKDYLSSDNLIWQYYNFGGGKEIILVLDKGQEFAYLYNRSGQLINYQPIEVSQEVSLLYFSTEDEYRLFKVFGNQFSILEFNY